MLLSTFQALICDIVVTLLHMYMWHISITNKNPCAFTHIASLKNTLKQFFIHSAQNLNHFNWFVLLLSLCPHSESCSCFQFVLLLQHSLLVWTFFSHSYLFCLEWKVSKNHGWFVTMEKEGRARCNVGYSILASEYSLRTENMLSVQYTFYVLQYSLKSMVIYHSEHTIWKKNKILQTH